MVAALIAAAVAINQQRSARRAEKEKLRLEDRLARERAIWDDERKATAQRQADARRFEERLEQQAVHATDQQKHAIEYRRKVVNRLRNLKILDMSRSLELERLYVQVRVREEEPPRFTGDEEIERAASGEPEKLLRVSREQLRTRSADAIRPEEALARFGRIVVLGDPGAGKTTMLRYLTFRAAREELGPGISLPVYVELRDFIDSRCPELLTYAVREFSVQYGFPEARSYLEQELEAARAVLLLDGLDEVLGGENAEAADEAYRKVAAEADRLATRYPGAPIALTCRKAGWRGGLPQFTTLEVLDFDWPEIQNFIDNWFADIPAKATGLRDALSANLRMQTLAANPLLLSLIAIVYERELELPERRSELYNRCVEVLLKDWDAHREIRRFSRFTTDRKRDLLQEVAWTFHRAGRRYFPADELLAIIRDFLPTIDIEASSAQAILDEIVTQYGLLKVQAHGWYGFLHLTLQEYFAAIAANERGQAAVREVARFRHDPWWEEVIGLLAGRMADASPLLLALLGRDTDAPEPPPGEALAVCDDIFHGDLLLAGHCLTARPRLRDRWLRDRLMAELMRLLLEAPYPPVYRRAARILAEIGGEANQRALLSHIVDTALDEGRRAAIAYAIGSAGATAVAPRLLTAFEQLGHEQDEYVGGAVADTLAELRYSRALPVLLHHIETVITYRNTIDGANAGIIIALKKFGDKSIKGAVWNLVEKVHKDKLVIPFFLLVPIIGEVGDESDIEKLLNLAGPDFIESQPVLEAAVKLSGGAVATELYESILNPQTSPYSLEVVVNELVRLKRPEVLERAFKVLLEPGIDWRIKWITADIIGSYSCRDCEESLVRIFAIPELNEHVRLRIAGILAEWDNPVGLDLLHSAFADGKLPDSVVFRDANYAAFNAALPTARALRHLGDETVIEDLLREYELLGSRAYESISGEFPEIIAEFRPMIVVKDIIRYRSKASTVTVNLLHKAMTKDSIPLILSAMESGELRLDRQSIQTMAGLMDSADDASRLFGLLNQAREADKDALAEALDQVSRRARVRVFADGSVRSGMDSVS